MKKINLYKTRKTFILIFLIVLLILFISILVTQDWNDPSWSSILSSGLNVIAFSFILTTTYRDTRIELHKDKVVYRLAGQRQDASIEVYENTDISHDWKGVYFKNDNASEMISTNYMSKDGSARIFQTIEDYYKRTV